MNIHMKKNEDRPLLTQYTKINPMDKRRNSGAYKALR
jgi:hypothetical protein